MPARHVGILKIKPAGMCHRGKFPASGKEKAVGIAKAVEFETTKRALQAELEKGGGMERLRDMLLAESTLEYLMEKNSNNQTRRDV